MKHQISSSEISIFSDKYTEKAWHLTSVLLSIGRPACPAELAGKCSLFPASPDFVEFLCSIPNSPIFLTGNNFVLPSMAAFTAFVEFFASSMLKVQIGVRGARMLCGDVVKTYFRKRKMFGNEVMQLVKKRAVLNFINENERDNQIFSSNERTVRSCFQVVDLHTAQIGRVLDTLPFGMSTKAVNLQVSSNTTAVRPLTFNSNVELLEYQLNSDEEARYVNKPNRSPVDGVHKGVRLEEHPDYNKDNGQISDMPGLYRRTTASLLESLAEISAILDESNIDQSNLVNSIDTSYPCIEPEQQNRNTLVEDGTVMNASNDLRNDIETERRIKELAEWLMMDDGPQERVENVSFGSFEKSNIFCGDNLCQTNLETSYSGIPAVKNELLNTNAGSETLVSADQQPVTQKSRTTYSATMRNVPQDELTQKQQLPSKSLQHSKVDIFNKKRKGQKEQNAISMKHKAKQIIKNSALLQEKCDRVPKSSKDPLKSKSFPEFESYIVEEEEGSGGYGTVYRARRKSDGVTFAIKCPHVNAHKNHVRNELKMLERFGGRNFVIKYKESFKNGNSDCFVLEHVEHDRPEVLKREINIFQLRLYGYCLFRALASLHEQGVLHRDVKPGNFLFSCKSNKGVLIDFNLAKDLHQKHEKIDKFQTSYPTSIQHHPALQSKSISPSKRRKILGGKPCEFSLGGKNLKEKTRDKLKAYDDLGRWNSITSQGAEASGLTSAKDITPSAEKLREPLPCQGRKELINLAQEAMQNPNRGAASAPSSNRKRVAASPGIVDRKHIYISPMPLHSSGIAIPGAGSLRNMEAKTHKEGPCAGTKGFRAPEVLLRSLHQGPKVDVWSAGVNLLYLITGRMAFSGDPEQNMKDIVKLRGNEELWEVAKLHNRESSFPMDLLDIRYHSSTSIKKWCVANTKRPDFVKQIPASLFDLIEKCLVVNPRMRITAEEALRHDFFDPCNDALQKQRSLRRGPNQTNSLSLAREMNAVKPVRPPPPPPYQKSITPLI